MTENATYSVAQSSPLTYYKNEILEEDVEDEVKQYFLKKGKATKVNRGKKIKLSNKAYQPHENKGLN